MSDILAAEWRKLLTSRAARYVVGVMAMFTALMLGVAWYFVTTWDALPADARQHASLAPLPELLGWIASLVMAVAGALAFSSEHASGMIVTTFLAMPSRSRVLAAKAVAVAGATFVISEAALAATLVGGALIIGDRVIAGQDPVGAHSVVLLVALGLSSVTFALIGLALGAITRSALATVVGLMLLWYIVPLLAPHAPAPWGEWLMSIDPGALAGELAGTGNANSVFGAALSPLAALAAMAAYAVIPLALATVVVRRRDV